MIVRPIIMSENNVLIDARACGSVFLYISEKIFNTSKKSECQHTLHKRYDAQMYRCWIRELKTLSSECR